ncbi:MULTISPECIES: pheST operon leader peptide PheM [Dickeya]|nr:MULTISPECIES: pheST operon leader peptide PheM [Dickeya]
MCTAIFRFFFYFSA